MHLPDELLATVRQCDSYWLHRDTICGRYAHVLGYISDALLWKDDLKGALEYRIRQIKVKDSIDDRENREETKRMAALYQAYEKEMALEKEKQHSVYLENQLIAARNKIAELERKIYMVKEIQGLLFLK